MIRQGVSFVILYVLLCSAPLFADEYPVYQLYIPSADEYLAALPSILDQFKDDPLAQEGYLAQNEDVYSSFLYLMWNEIQSQYAPLSDHSYAALERLHPYYASSFSAGLVRDMVIAWLRESPVNLDNYDTDHPLIFGDFVIKVTRYDFDVDGQHEWALEISYGDQYRWREVLQAVSPGRYQRIEAPFFVLNSVAHYTFPDLDQELAFEDLNQDGFPEWVIAIGGMGGGHKNHGYLLILQWQDGQIVDLTAENRISYSALAGGGSPLFPFGTSVELKDVDHNGTVDIQVLQKQQYDNLGCIWTQIRSYSWRKQQYDLIEETRQYDDTAGCAWRAAEEDMWQGNYESAIANYAQAFNMPITKDIVGYFNHELWEYEYVRWAMAYALTDRPKEAQQILDTLYAVGIQSGTVGQMYEILKRMIGERSEAVEICQTLYDLWQGYLDHADNLYKDLASQYRDEAVYISYEDVIDLNAYVGYILENYAMPNISGFPFPQPEKAGCNIALYGRPVRLEPPPTQTIEAMFVPPLPSVAYYPPSPLSAYSVRDIKNSGNDPLFLIMARFYLMQVQRGIVTGDEWEARYLFATALRQNNRLDEALEQYVYIYENSPLASWRQLAGLYLTPITD